MLKVGERIADVRKIAVLRANALGDFLFILPALEALRAAYPQAEIVLLGRRWHSEFLNGRPGPLDRALAVPPSRGVNEGDGSEDPAALADFFAEMRQERFDLALQLHGGGRHSNPFLRQLGARVTVGLKTPDAEPLDRWLPYVYFQNEVARFLEVTALAGAAPVTLEPRLQVTERDRNEACPPELEHDRPLVVLHPGATDPRRWWPSEKFAQVGDALAKAGAQVAVTGSPSERPNVTAVMAAMSAPALDLCGRLSLHGLTGLLARARLIVANDTGPLHLATAIGTPAVGIYWCINLMIACTLTRARHRPFPSWRVRCPDCGADMVRSRCAHESSLVADVPTAEVITAALELFHTPPAPRWLANNTTATGQPALLSNGAHSSEAKRPSPVREG